MFSTRNRRAGTALGPMPELSSFCGNPHPVTMGVDLRVNLRQDQSTYLKSIYQRVKRTRTTQ